MSILPRPASPRAFLADLRAVWRGDRRTKLVAGVVAIGMTSLIVTLFIIESWWGVLPEGERISYVADWPNDRSDAQIIAQQKIDRVARDKERAEKRRAFQKVDRELSGLGI